MSIYRLVMLDMVLYANDLAHLVVFATTAPVCSVQTN